MARLITFLTPIRQSLAPKIKEEMGKVGYKIDGDLRIVVVLEKLDLLGNDLTEQVRDVINTTFLDFKRDDILVLPGHPLYASLLVAMFKNQTGRLPVTLRRVERESNKKKVFLLSTIIDFESCEEIPLENPIQL